MTDTQTPLTEAGAARPATRCQDRWSHDKLVRSTHRVNATASCRCGLPPETYRGARRRQCPDDPADAEEA
ncbi:hypothetical protein [Streptomyces sp. NPDC048191]|uniref:hypothetical protein n=1 Tax=Streptomyces sp. NPDC048191 TaxID=3155484 RepID=UPI0033F843D4